MARSLATYTGVHPIAKGRRLSNCAAYNTFNCRNSFEEKQSRNPGHYFRASKNAIGPKRLPSNSGKRGTLSCAAADASGAGLLRRREAA
jgi:hypothetical protein